MLRRLSRSHSSAAPAAILEQTFEVVCFCGETLGGLREPKHQQVFCPSCGKSLFVLPADCRRAAKPRHLSKSDEPPSSGGLIERLNRLAFWTRLRQRRTALGGRVGPMAAHVGRWLKKYFSAKHK